MTAELSVDAVCAGLCRLFTPTPPPPALVDDDQVPDPHSIAEAQHRAVTRAQRAVERARDRSPLERLPRIEELRTSCRATIEMLELVFENLEDLRLLATDRAAAADNLGRRGSTRDYALDSHGDPRARKLYHQVGWELLDMLQDSSEAAVEIIRFFKDGELAPGRRGVGRKATPEEIDEAIERQAHRRARGEYTPIPLVSQPMVRTRTKAQLREDLDALRRAAQKVHPWRLTRDQDRVLTHAERSAWVTAVPAPISRGRQKQERPVGGWSR